MVNLFSWLFLSKSRLVINYFILSFVKNDIAIHDQNLSALKILSKKNELNEENSLKEALFKFKEEFKPNNYNSRLYKLLNDYHDQIN